MDSAHLPHLVSILEAYVAERGVPVVSQLAATEPNPFLILISTVLSSRTKDEVTAQATERLFARARTPEEMLILSPEEIAQLIYPVGFYRTKARIIRELCQDLVTRFQGEVPHDLEQLLSLNGVGRKTANLVLALGFDDDAICVDTHVHRITNRLGYVSTRTPVETERALRETLPRPYWKRWNTLLVSFGQEVCRPLSPRCSICPLAPYCDRVGVERHR